MSEKNFYPDSETTTATCFSFSSLMAPLWQLQLGNVELDSSDSEDESYSPAALPDLPYKDEPLSLRSTIEIDDVMASKIWAKKTPVEKLTEIRHLMKKCGIAVYIVPLEDEHQLEYTALADRRREFISGFTGSAGIAIITLLDGDLLSGEAALLTDGRYFLQAHQELDLKYWKLLKQGVAGYPNWKQYAVDQAIASKFLNVISCDPRLLSLADGDWFTSMNLLKYQGKFVFKPLLEVNLVDEVWGPDKPLRSMEKVYQLDIEYSGETLKSKLERIRKKMGPETCFIISALEDVAWLFNLRAEHEIPFNPFFFAYSIVTSSKVTLYIEKLKLEGLKFDLDDLEIKGYSDFYEDLKLIESSVNKEISCNQVIFPTKGQTSYALYSLVPQSYAKMNARYESIVADLKMIKNETELINAKIAQYKDSLAFIVFLSWLEHQLVDKNTKNLLEYEAACKIYSIRQLLPNFKGLSYETILSTGPNAAIIHYAPTKEHNSLIDPETPYLLDSGAHYLEGTTDITRTYMFGKFASKYPKYRKWYTLVLKGHLAIATAKFPPNLASTGATLDAFARQALWNEGLDYGHGTGHGVGAFGNVHEAPLYISPSSRADLFQPGEILTDEPGFYVNGKCGFRVESELEVIRCGDELGKTRSGDNFLGFKYLTKVPLCKALIDKYYLLPLEIDWINDYHKNVFNEFGQKLLDMGDKRSYKWLQKETLPI